MQAQVSKLKTTIYILGFFCTFTQLPNAPGGGEFEVINARKSQVISVYQGTTTVSCKIKRRAIS